MEVAYFQEGDAFYKLHRSDNPKHNASYIQLLNINIKRTEGKFEISILKTAFYKEFNERERELRTPEKI